MFFFRSIEPQNNTAVRGTTPDSSAFFSAQYKGYFEAAEEKRDSSSG